MPKSKIMNEFEWKLYMYKLYTSPEMRRKEEAYFMGYTEWFAGLHKLSCKCRCDENTI